MEPRDKMQGEECHWRFHRLWLEHQHQVHEQSEAVLCTVWLWKRWCYQRPIAEQTDDLSCNVSTRPFPFSVPRLQLLHISRPKNRHSTAQHNLKWVLFEAVHSVFNMSFAKRHYLLLLLLQPLVFVWTIRHQTEVASPWTLLLMHKPEMNIAIEYWSVKSIIFVDDEISTVII